MHPCHAKGYTGTQSNSFVTFRSAGTIEERRASRKGAHYRLSLFFERDSVYGRRGSRYILLGRAATKGLFCTSIAVLLLSR